MNIFALDNDPTLAAQWQCDKHVVKMIVETAQLLSTAHRILDGDLAVITNYRNGKPSRRKKVWVLEDGDADKAFYAVTHPNHPCNIWCRENASNYSWLYHHFVALVEEYQLRYNRKHATATRLKDFVCAIPQNIPSGKITPFAIAMKSVPECIVESDPVASYRNYYKHKVSTIDMRWKIPEHKPDFL